LLVRIAPKMSIEECALALLNNGRRFVGQRSPEALIRVKIEQLWQASAYAATTGGHDGVGEGISERARVGWTLTIPQLPLGGFGRVAGASGRLDLNHPPTAVGGIAKREKNEDCRSIKASVSAHNLRGLSGAYWIARMDFRSRRESVPASARYFSGQPRSRFLARCSALPGQILYQLPRRAGPCCSIRPAAVLEHRVGRQRFRTLATCPRQAFGSADAATVRRTTAERRGAPARDLLD